MFLIDRIDGIGMLKILHRSYCASVTHSWAFYVSYLIFPLPAFVVIYDLHPLERSTKSIEDGNLSQYSASLHPLSLKLAVHVED